MTDEFGLRQVQPHGIEKFQNHARPRAHRNPQEIERNIEVNEHDFGEAN